MENNKAVLYMLTETKYSMMSFVIITKENRAIVIDGGWEEDMPRLKQYIGGREIAAWILTHPHKDHISGFVSEMKKDGGKDFNIAAIYHHFPNMSDMNKEKVADIDYYKAEFLADFEQSKKRDRTRMFGTAVTRRWMEQLGVKQHYYTKDGTQQITI